MSDARGREESQADLHQVTFSRSFWEVCRDVTAATIDLGREVLNAVGSSLADGTTPESRAVLFALRDDPERSIGERYLRAKTYSVLGTPFPE